VGYPYHTGGGPTEKTRVVDAFIERLSALAPDLSIRRHDERFSTVSAMSFAAGRKRKARRDKGILDRFAAAVILQDFLDETVGQRV
jgi:putative Holliday junction resolvase